MKKQPFKEGKEREYHLVNDLIAYNSDIEYVRDSTKQEDIDKHFDKIVKNTKTNQIIKLDAKSPSKFGDKYFWVEDMAVYARNKHGIPRLGSIHGEADWMAWEMSDHWLMGRRTYLEHIMDTKVDKSNPTIEPRAEKDIDAYLYKLRGREDRGDKISLFCLDDLDQKHFRKIPKLPHKKEKKKVKINELF